MMAEKRLSQLQRDILISFHVLLPQKQKLFPDANSLEFFEIVTAILSLDGFDMDCNDHSAQFRINRSLENLAVKGLITFNGLSAFVLPLGERAIQLLKAQQTSKTVEEKLLSWIGED